MDKQNEPTKKQKKGTFNICQWTLSTTTTTISSSSTKRTYVSLITVYPHMENTRQHK